MKNKKVNKQVPSYKMKEKNQRKGKVNNDSASKQNKQTITNQIINKNFGYSTKANLIIYLIIIVSGFILYSNTIPFGYTFDDKLLVTKNEFTKKGIEGISDILTSDSFASYFGEKQNLVAGGRYRPVSPITLAIEYEFFGENSHVSHSVNIVLYIVCGILLFTLLSNLLLRNLSRYNDGFISTQKKWYLSLPFIATLLYMFHPIHTEVVANIKGRDEMLTFIGAIATLLLTLKYLDTKKIVYLILSPLIFFLGLMSKENAITFIAIIPLTIYFFTNHTWKRNLITLVPLIVVAGIFIYIRGKVLGTNTTDIVPELMNNPFLHASISEKYATIFYTLGIYIKLLFFPHPLTYDYYPKHIPIINWMDLRAIVPLILYLALGVYALIKLKSKTILSYSIWFYLITFSIVSNVFFPIGAFMGERFVFISSFGFCIALAYLLTGVLPRYVKLSKAILATVLPLLIVVIALYSFKTIDRNKAWKDDYTLFTTDVETSKESAFGNLTAGKQYYFKGKVSKDSVERQTFIELGIKHLTKSVELHDKYINALFYLAEAHYEYDKNWEKSVEYLERLSLLISNTDKKKQGVICYRIGAMYGKHSSDIPKSIKFLKKSLEMIPDYDAALKNLGAIYFNIKRYNLAIELFERYLKLKPNDVATSKNLAAAYANIGDTDNMNKYLALAQKNKKVKNE